MLKLTGNLLFVCAGNSCRSPMAMKIAEGALGNTVTCDSAAGQLKGGKFKAGGGVSKLAVEALKELGLDLSEYKPKKLNYDLVKKADYIFFLGEKFMINAKSRFKDFTDKMYYYGEYESKLSGKMINDIPDPLDGQSWEDYFGKEVNKPVKEDPVVINYTMVADIMKNRFQPVLQDMIQKAPTK